METHHIDPNRASKLCVQTRANTTWKTTGLPLWRMEWRIWVDSKFPGCQVGFSSPNLTFRLQKMQETHLPWPSASAFCTHSWCGPMMRDRKQLPATLSSPGMHGSSSPHWDIWKLSAWHSGGVRKFQLGIDPQWPPSVSVNIQTYLVACTVFLHHSPNAGKRFCPWSQDRTK